MRALARFVAGFTVAVCVGCFQDAGGGGEGCPAGAAGCDCTAGGGCDPGLACVMDVDVCVPEGCDAGSLGCTCADGQCIGALVCEGSVCREPNDGSGGDTSASTTAATATTSEVETTIADSGSPETGGDATTTAADGSGSGSESETGDPPGCLHCWDAFQQGVHASNPSVCGSSFRILDSFYTCVCSAMNCGFEDYACKDEQNLNYCDGAPPHDQCETCAMTNCGGEYNACQGDA